MAVLGISLARYNSGGICASINDEDDEVCIAVKSRSQNASGVCRDAAKRLRLLADAFDLLAGLDDPFKGKTHQAALAAAKAASRGGVSV